MTMMRGVTPLVLALALAALPGMAWGQGRGQGQGQEQRPRGQGQAEVGQGQGAEQRAQGRGQGQGAEQRAQGRGQGQGPEQRAQGRGQGGGRGMGGAKAAPGQVRRGLEDLPVEVRRLAGGERSSGRMVAGAAARARLRGAEAADLDVRVDAERVRILNRRGETLVDLDDARARRLGAWDVRLLGDDRPRANAPAFCESGAGHPVWGRQWCLDKGFGLGGRDGYLWGRSEIDDVVFRRRSDSGVLDRGTLIDVLGDVVLGRLALHALTLGLTEPVSGVWVAGNDAGAPRILQVRAGDAPVAELVDLDRDDGADVLFVVNPVWY